MIRNFRITIDKFIYSYLLPDWRKTVRLSYQYVLLTPFKVMMDEFVQWRDLTIIKGNVTCETASIEWYLNELFDKTLRRITIGDADEGGVYIGREDTEPADYIYIGKEDIEPADYVYFALEGEGQFGTADFVVYIPAAISASKYAIAAVVKIYAFAHYSFVIIEQ